MKILVAEDDLDIANLHKLVLEAANHAVILTLNGQECINKYHQGAHTFDAILLDYKMPILDGIQTAKEILRIHPSQRIIIATGQLKDTLSDAIRKLGKIVEIISKPFEPELLLAVIEDTTIDAKVRQLNITTGTTYGEKRLDSQIDKLINRLRSIQEKGTL